MKPNWVLSDEQCNIRFRRIRQEKGALKEMKQELEEAPEILTEIKREQQTSPVATSKYKQCWTVNKMVECWLQN